jgi:hypothetical protein
MFVKANSIPAWTLMWQELCWCSRLCWYLSRTWRGRRRYGPARTCPGWTSWWTGLRLRTFGYRRHLALIKLFNFFCFVSEWDFTRTQSSLCLITINKQGRIDESGSFRIDGQIIVKTLNVLGYILQSYFLNDDEVDFEAEVLFLCNLF